MHISILSSSTRIDRLSHRVALALEKAINRSGQHSVTVLDLAVYNFPIMEEVLHRHPNPPEGLAEFSAEIRQSDAVLFVSPEYNGSFTAALKNAVDYLKESEFSKKVVGVVSVSAGALGGMRAALAMQQLVLGVSGFPIPQMLMVPQVASKFDESGTVLDPVFEQKIEQYLAQFQWLAEAVAEKKMATVV